MELNIPKTCTTSHELPIFSELARESGLPISEVKARFRNEMLDKYEEVLDDPSKQLMGDDGQELVHSAVNSLRQKLERPEEQPDSGDDFDDIIGFDPNEPPPGADMFSQSSGGDAGFGGFGEGGGFGGGAGGFGGGAGGGIDNLDLGFSDEGMDAINSVDSGFDGFGDDITGDSVNAMSEVEPGGEEPSGDEEGGSEEPPETENFDDLAEG